MKTKHYIWSILLLAMPVLSGCADKEGEFTSSEESRTKSIFMALSLKNPALKTRQSTAITQADEKTDGSHFRGISDLTILPFIAGRVGSDCIAAGDAVLGSKIGVDETLADLYHDAAGTKGSPNDKYYLEVRLEQYTNAFLVYGRATGNNGDLAGKQANGILAKTEGTKAGDFTFSPVPMVETIAEGKAAGAAGDAIITYLNTIFNANWADRTNYPALYGVYPMVQSMQAGSSANVLAFLNRVYEMLLPARANTYVDAALDAIEAGATISGGKITALPTACQNFPGDLGLPDGAAVIGWNNNKFEAITDKTNFNGLNVDVSKFCFPAELWYRANSRIHTSTRPLVSTLTPAQQAESVFNKITWAGTDDNSVLGQKNGTEDLFTPNGTVLNNTTIVAITDPLQYAVGRLDVYLKVNDGVTVLKDADDKDVDITKLAITGILVGQQGPVDFNFHGTVPDGATESDFPLYTIYDNQIETAASTIGAETPTHTLALETMPRQKVNVAIELQNNTGENIMTQSGDLAQIIPNGCKFYVIGQIDPANPTTTSATAGNKAIAQDHYTTVTFLLSDITKAYYVIPDLNSADLEFTVKAIDWKLSTPSEVVLE